jgi:hypothetical protein
MTSRLTFFVLFYFKFSFNLSLFGLRIVDVNAPRDRAPINKSCMQNSNRMPTYLFRDVEHLKFLRELQQPNYGLPMYLQKWHCCDLKRYSPFLRDFRDVRTYPT